MTSAFDIDIFPARQDNNIYVLHDRKSTKSAVIDPTEDAPVLECLKEKGRNLTKIFCTHHHSDHVGGVIGLKKRTGAVVYAYSGDMHRIRGADIAVDEGSTVEFAGNVATIMHLPGHTSGSIAYRFVALKQIFVGDVLFEMGCGRIFEGTHAQLFMSLCRLKNLPDETLVYTGHEYAHGNARFALTIDGNNPHLIKRFKEIANIQEDIKGRGAFTNPTTIGKERLTNPYFRTDDEEICQFLGMEDASDLEVFTEIRKRKDAFTG